MTTALDLMEQIENIAGAYMDHENPRDLYDDLGDILALIEDWNALHPPEAKVCT